MGHCAAIVLLASEAFGSVADTVRTRLIDSGWSAPAIESLLETHESEFELDARSGWLPQRLEHFSRLGRHRAAVRMIEAFPEFADLFANAAEPGRLAEVINDLATDRQDRARLLNLFIGWHSRSEITHLQNVLDLYGPSLMAFADSDRLFSVAEALALGQAEQAPDDWTEWVAAELRKAGSDPEKFEVTLVAITTHGAAIAHYFESEPGYAAAFPDYWSMFRHLVESQPTQEARAKMLTGLLSHEGLWLTLAEPFGAAALSRTAIDQVPGLLLALWGSEGWVQPAEASGPLLGYGAPMLPERRAWLLNALAAGEEQRRSLGEWGVFLPYAEAFWSIALDPERTDLLPCVLVEAQLESSWDGTPETIDDFLASLDDLAALLPAGLRRHCKDDAPMLVRAIPGYYFVKVIGNLWAGAPVEPLDIASTATELYALPRYAALLVRGARAVTPEALRLGPLMTLDHLRTQSAAHGLGGQRAVRPRPIAGRARAFVLVDGGWLAPVPRHGALHEGQRLVRETLENLAAEGLSGSDAAQRVILHFRCAAPIANEDPQCQ